MGTGTIQATVYAGGRGGSTGGGVFDSSVMDTTLGSSSYNCAPSQPPIFGNFCGTFLGTHRDPLTGLIVTDYAQTGTFILGQLFTAGFSLSDSINVQHGEQGGATAVGGITNLQFFDAAGNPVTPAEAPVPEPMMVIPVGIALVLLNIARKRY